MPKKSGIYPKSKGKWRVRIWHKGVRQDWIVEGSQKDAEAFRARKLVQIQQDGGFPETRSAPTFSNFCVTRYAPYAQVHLKLRTYVNRTYTIRTLITFFGALKLTEISTAKVIEYQQRRLKENVEPSTINDEIKILKAVINHAIALSVPATKIVAKNLTVRKKKRLKFWTTEQVQMLLTAVSEHSPAIYWLVLFLLETGCRRGEAIALEFVDVDLERSLIKIQPNEEWQPKDNEAREIPLDAKGVLMSWLRDEATSKRRYVFVSRKKNEKTGEPLPYAFWPQLKFDRARAAAGFTKGCPHCRVDESAKARNRQLKIVACHAHGITGGPHTTRHTFASHFLAHNPDLFLLSRLLGHSHERVTKLYAHLLPEHLDRARGVVKFTTPVGIAEMKARARWQNDD